MANFTEIEYEWCEAYLEKLVHHPLAVPFLRPVDPERDLAPDYLRVIANPMDLGTIHDKFSKGEYQNSDDLFRDIDLVWTNGYSYNKKGLLFSISKYFKAKCEKEYKRVPKTKADEWNRKVVDTQKKISALLALPFPEETLLPRHFDLSDNKSPPE